MRNPETSDSQTVALSVVVPIKDEESSIDELCERLKSTLAATVRSYEIIFVDDGSTDRSREILARLANQDEHIQVLEFSRNFGQTAALAAGIDLARGEAIVTMDGDLQHAPEEIPRFLAKLEEGYDLVSGCREVRTDSYLLRRLPSLCANRLMGRASGLSIRDFGSTYKAYRASVLKRVELFGELHRFIPVLAHRLGARIVEIPITVHPRKQGASKYGLGRVTGVFEDIIFLHFYSKYLTKPIRAFGSWFFLFFGSGFTIASILMCMWMAGMMENVNERSGLLLFSTFLMIVGVQFLVTGLLAELLSRIYFNTSGSKIYTVRRQYRSTLRS